MKFIDIIKKILMLATPFIKNLIESKVVPKLKRKAYERFDNFANDHIESLAELCIKIKNTDDKEKKQKHIEGYILGIKALRAVSNKISQACDVLEKALDE